MTTPALALTAAATPAASANAPAATSTDVNATDFMLMLGQLLGGATKEPAEGTASGEKKEDSTTDETAATVLPTPMVVAIPIPMLAEIAQSQPPSTDDAVSAAISSIIPKAAETLLDTANSAVTQFGATDANGTSAHAKEAAPTFALPNASQLATAPTITTQPQVDMPHARQLQTPVGANGWSDELGTRLTLMADKGLQTASMRLSPEHLGPLEVRVQVQNDQATVWFSAAHADTRAALEHAIPRLRELFAAQGMSLTDAGVYREPPRDQSRSNNSNGTSSEQGEETIAAVSRVGLIDAYA